MKKSIWVILITFLFPAAAFSESCNSLLRGKNIESEKVPKEIYIAWGTHEWTKETDWGKCSTVNEDPLLNTYKCGGRQYSVNSLSGRMWVKDKNGRSFELNYDGGWQKGTFPCEKLAENSYRDGRTSWRKATIEGAGVKVLLRMDNEYKYSTYEANF